MAAYVVLASEEEREHAAWLANRDAKQKEEFARREGGDANEGENKGRGDGQTLNGSNRRQSAPQSRR